MVSFLRTVELILITIYGQNLVELFIAADIGMSLIPGKERFFRAGIRGSFEIVFNGE